MTEGKKFNLSETKVPKYSKFLHAGINDVEIEGFEEKATQSGTPYIEITMSNLEKTSEFKDKFWSNTDVKPGKEKSAFDYSMMRIRHLAEAVLTNDQLKSISGNSISEITSNLNRMLVGKKLRVKIGGEEFNGSDGVKVGLRLPFLGFAESLSVPEASSSLTFSEARDIKRLGNNPFMSDRGETKKPLFD